MSAQLSPDQPDLSPEDVAKIFDVSRHIVLRWALADYGPPVYVVEIEIRFKRDEVITWKRRTGSRISGHKPVRAAQHRRAGPVLRTSLHLGAVEVSGVKGG